MKKSLRARWDRPLDDVASGVHNFIHSQPHQCRISHVHMSRGVWQPQAKRNLPRSSAQAAREQEPDILAWTVEETVPNFHPLHVLLHCFNQGSGSHAPRVILLKELVQVDLQALLGSACPRRRQELRRRPCSGRAPSTARPVQVGAQALPTTLVQVEDKVEKVQQIEHRCRARS